jgi:hypothetical protein
VTVDKATARKLARLANAEETCRLKHADAAAAFRLAVVEARENGGTLREIGEASGRSFARIHQIVRGVTGSDNRGSARPRAVSSE